MSFIVGAVFGGRLGVYLGADRGELLARVALIEAALVAVTAVLTLLGPATADSPATYAQIIALGVCMGLQNAAVRKLAVPDLTTTVLTMTITAFAADTRPAAGTGVMAGCRVVAIVAMLAGAALGPWCVTHTSSAYPLLLVLVVLLGVALATMRWGASRPRWTQQ